MKSTMSPASRRRAFQWSIRTVLILVVVCGFWFEHTSRRMRRQRSAVEWVHNHGGYVEYDSKPDAVPGWLVRFAGVDFFCDVKRVTLHNTGVDNLAPLADLPKLEQLAISERHVNDLNPVAALTQLNVLSVDQTPIRDLSPLLQLKQLKDLSFTGTEITKAHFEDFENQVSGGVSILYWPKGFCPR